MALNMHAFNKRMIFHINLLALILCCLLFAVYYTAKRAIAADSAVRHSSEVLRITGRMQFLAAESGMRARRYLLMGEPASIKKFMMAEKSLLKELASFKKFTAKDRHILSPLDSLNTYINQRIVVSGKMIQIRRDWGFNAALAHLQNGKNDVYVDEADMYINLINAREQKLLDQRKALQANTQLQRNIALSITLLFILLIIIILIYDAMKESLLRKKMIVDLLRKDARNKKAEQLAALGSWTLVPGTGIINASEEMFKIWEMDPNTDGTSYEHFISHIHPEDQDRIRQKIAMLNSQTYIDSYVFRLLIRGKIKYINTAVSVVHDEDEAMEHISGYVQDITEKKTAELELEQMFHTLKDRNTTLEEFNYMVSHTLRKPVANIIALCDLIGMETVPQELQDITNNIQTSAADLDKTVKGMNNALQVKKKTDSK